jgi:hypothetical protein
MIAVTPVNVMTSEALNSLPTVAADADVTGAFIGTEDGARESVEGATLLASDGRTDGVNDGTPLRSTVAVRSDGPTEGIEDGTSLDSGWDTAKGTRLLAIGGLGVCKMGFQLGWAEGDNDGKSLDPTTARNHDG